MEALEKENQELKRADDFLFKVEAFLAQRLTLKGQIFHQKHMSYR